MSSLLLTTLEKEISDVLKLNARQAREIGKMFAFRITTPDGFVHDRVIDCTLSPPMLLFANQPNPNVTVEISLEDLKILLENPVLGMQLYFQNKIRISGDAHSLPELEKIFSSG